MKEYVKSEQHDTKYSEVVRYSGGRYIIKYDVELNHLPIHSVLIGTYNVWESGYDIVTGNTYDECFVEFY